MFILISKCSLPLGQGWAVGLQNQVGPPPSLQGMFLIKKKIQPEFCGIDLTVRFFLD